MRYTRYAKLEYQIKYFSYVSVTYVYAYPDVETGICVVCMHIVKPSLSVRRKLSLMKKIKSIERKPKHALMI